jgi:REP element-mobilizing transposase RayT
VFDGGVDEVLKEVCLEIAERYQMKFLEIGADEDYIHFLVQSVPACSVTKIEGMLKSVTRERYSGVARKSKNNCGAENSGRTVLSQARLESMAMNP